MKKEKESATLPKHITLHHLESCNDISRPYIILNNLKNHMTKEHAANTGQKLDKQANAKQRKCGFVLSKVQLGRGHLRE